MAEKIDDITIAYKDPATSKELVREIEKEVLTRGAWSTIVFKYRERTQNQEEFGAIKYRVGRYRKQNGEFRPQSKFNISNVKQAKDLVAILTRWADEDSDDS
jgi:hypothetical protein